MSQQAKFNHISENMQYFEFWPCIGYYRPFISLFIYKILRKLNINANKFYPTKTMIIKFAGIKVILRPNHEDLLYYSGAAKFHFTEKWFRVKAGENVIDVGSNVGRYSLIAAKKKANVISLEADPETFDIFFQNCNLNKFKNIRPINKAASNKTGWIELYRARGYDGISTVEQRWILENGRTITEKCEIQSEKLDNLNIFKQVDWLLIDVEGHELEVLEGAIETLKVTKRVIIEVEKSNRERVLAKLKDFKIVDEISESELDNYIFLIKIENRCLVI